MSTSKAWMILVVAGLLEPVWMYLMLKSNGFSRPVFGIAGSLIIALEFGLFTHAMSFLPLSLAYSVWCGIGAISVLILSIWLGETISTTKLFFFFLIMSGVIGLKFF